MMRKARTSRIDESPSMASPLAMSSTIAALAKDGFPFQDATMGADLLTIIPWIGEVTLSDAAHVLDLPKGRLGAAVNRLVKRGIMSRRTSKGESCIAMTDFGRAMVSSVVVRDEDLVRKLWRPETDLTYGVVRVIMADGPGIISRIAKDTGLPRAQVEEAIDALSSLLPTDPDFSVDPDADHSFLDEAFFEDISSGDASLAEEETQAPAPATLSKNDRKLLDWLVSPKKTQEVADHLGVSRQRAQKRLSALEAAGHLTATQPRARYSKFYQALGQPDARIEEENPMISPIAQSPGGPKANIVCDQCGTTAAVRCNYEHKSTGHWKPDEGQILIRAKGLGWEMVKGKHYCPSCKEERKSAKKAANSEAPPKLTVVETTPIADPAPAAAPVPPPVAAEEITKPAESLQSRPVLSLPDLQNIEKDPIMAAPTPLHMAKTTQPRSPSTEPPREPTVVQNRQIRTLLDEVYDVDAGRYKGAESDITVADTLKDDGVMPGWVARIRETLYGSGSGNEEEETLGEDIKALAEDLSTRLEAVETLAKKVVADLKEIEKDRLKLKDLQTRFDRWKANLGPKGRAV